MNIDLKKIQQDRNTSLHVLLPASLKRTLDDKANSEGLNLSQLVRGVLIYFSENNDGVDYGEKCKELESQIIHLNKVINQNANHFENDLMERQDEANAELLFIAQERDSLRQILIERDSRIEVLEKELSENDTSRYEEVIRSLKKECDLVRTESSKEVERVMLLLEQKENSKCESCESRKEGAGKVVAKVMTLNKKIKGLEEELHNKKHLVGDIKNTFLREIRSTEPEKFTKDFVERKMKNIYKRLLKR